MTGSSGFVWWPHLANDPLFVALPSSPTMRAVVSIVLLVVCLFGVSAGATTVSSRPSSSASAAADATNPAAPILAKDVPIRPHRLLHSHPGWSALPLSHPACPRSLVSLSFFLTGSAADRVRLEQAFQRVSDPRDKEQYTKYWTKDQLEEIAVPTQGQRELWVQWASEVTTGKEDATFTWDPTRTILRVNLRVADMERLLGARLHVYEHKATSLRHTRSDLSSPEFLSSSLLPAALRETVSHVSGVTRFPVHIEMKAARMKVAEAARMKDMKFTTLTNPIVSPITPFDQLASEVKASVGTASDQQVLTNTMLSTDDSVVTMLLSLACDASAVPWVLPTVQNGQMACAKAGTIFYYNSATLVLSNTAMAFKQTYSIPLSAAGVHLFQAGPLKGQYGLGIKVALPTNYDRFAATITYTYISSDQKQQLQTPYTYPFQFAGLTRIHPSTVQQYYNVPDQLTTTATSKASEQMSVAALALQDPSSQGFYDEQDISDFLTGNFINSGNVDGLSYRDGSAQPIALDQSNPDGETTLDISMGMGTNVGVGLTVLHATAAVDTAFEDMLNLAFNDQAIHVLSISYGIYESELGDSLGYSNTIFQKLALRGVSVFASSGDSGAFIYGNPNGTCSSFAPSFPASSPYLTSVGGTTLTRSITKTCPTEVVASLEFGSMITAGGGFSQLASQMRPSWQDAAVNSWLNNAICQAGATKVLPWSAAYRVYPDVSLFAHNYDVFFRSGSTEWPPESSAVDGTSASSPVLAGIISQYNVVRIQAGLAPLGFLNPLLYSAFASEPRSFNDITAGSNRCLSGGLGCCEEGFQACEGFDPVTGLGSPNFKYLQAFLLPAGYTPPTIVSNNFFPDCVPSTPTPSGSMGTYVPLGDVDWGDSPYETHISGKTRTAVILVSLLMVALVGAAIYFGLRRYHLKTYGSAGWREGAGGNFANVAPGGGGGNGPAPGPGGPGPRVWGAGNRLGGAPGNDLSQPLNN
jgi:hypothetical protein